MDKKDLSICDCGKLHNLKTENIYVEKNCLEILLKSLKFCKFEKILVFYSTLDSVIINKIKNIFRKNKQ